MLITFLIALNISIVIYFVFISIGYVLLMVLSIPDTFSRYREVEDGSILSVVKSYSLPPISVIMPAYNEEVNICDSINSIINNDYENTFLIIVNDGSTDNTLKTMQETYRLIEIKRDIENKIQTTDSIKGYYISETHKNLTVIDKYHTDRSDSINIGVNACLTPFLMTIDADTLIEEEAISRVVFYLLSKPNIDAVGGGVYVLNSCTLEDGKISDARIPKKPIYAFQACEYLRSFLFSKSGWNPLQGALCYSGTSTALKTAAVINVGGFDIGNLAQDFEIITHIRAEQYERNLSTSVGYTPASIVWTDVPGTFIEYWRQRFNWQYYTLDSLMQYKRMLFNSKYGVVGFFTYPFFLFFEALGAVVEFTAYCCIIFSLLLGVLNVYMAVIWYAFAWGFFTLLTMSTVFINFNTFNKYRRVSDLFLILFYTIVEGFGFRQFHITCRVAATFSYFFGTRKRKAKLILAS